VITTQHKDMKEKRVIRTPVSQIHSSIISLGLSQYISDGTISDDLLRRQVKYPTNWRAKLNAQLGEDAWRNLTKNPRYCALSHDGKSYIMPVGSLLHIVSQCVEKSNLNKDAKRKRRLEIGQLFMECLTSDCGVVLREEPLCEVIYTLHDQETDCTPITYNSKDSIRRRSDRKMQTEAEEMIEGYVERVIEKVFSDSESGVPNEDGGDSISDQPEPDPSDVEDLDEWDECLNLRDAGYIVGCEPEALRARGRRGTLKTFNSGQGRRTFVMKSELIRSYPDKEKDIREFKPVGSPTSQKRIEEQNELNRKSDMRQIRADTENAIQDAYSDMLSAMDTRLRSVRWEVAIVGALAIISLAVQFYMLSNGGQQ